MHHTARLELVDAAHHQPAAFVSRLPGRLPFVALTEFVEHIRNGRIPIKSRQRICGHRFHFRVDQSCRRCLNAIRRRFHDFHHLNCLLRHPDHLIRGRLRLGLRRLAVAGRGEETHRDRQQDGEQAILHGQKKRAGDETRTRDIFLGKEVLYQLSYTRKADRKYEKAGAACQSPLPAHPPNPKTRT